MSRRPKAPTVQRCTVAGVDLSLTSSGVVVLPPEWEPGNWSSIYSMSYGEKLDKSATETQLVGRCKNVAARITGYIEEAWADHDCTGRLHIAVEQYAFTSRFNRERLGELGGIAKMVLLDAFECPLESVSPASARKFMFGKLPRKDVKKHVEAALRDMGCPFKTNDEMDAFVIANYVRSSLGLSALSLA